ncbi:MAG TPA: DciA family protein [Nocardioides sp.]|nr:DciA family protein [Nocardioides sp.]
MTTDDDDLPVPEPASEPEGEATRRDDGLDLARALTRATAKSTPAARRKVRRKDTPGRGRVTGAHPDDRDPQLLDTTLSRLVDDHGWELDLRVHGVFGRWAELVGAEIALHCTPESFTEGRLVVRTDSTAWATQLRLLAPTVVRRLNEELGHGTVALIEVLGPHGPSWKKGPRSVRDGRGPRDTYG